VLVAAADPAAVCRQHEWRFPVPAAHPAATSSSQGHVVRPREASVVHRCRAGSCSPNEANTQATHGYFTWYGKLLSIIYRRRRKGKGRDDHEQEKGSIYAYMAGR
jgi:hypothetical protein